MDKISSWCNNTFPRLSLLIQSVQRIEGNPDCFGTAGEYCDRLDCNWRSYCLVPPESPTQKDHRENKKENSLVSDNDSVRNSAHRTRGLLSPLQSNTCEVDYDKTRRVGMQRTNAMQASDPHKYFYF